MRWLWLCASILLADSTSTSRVVFVGGEFGRRVVIDSVTIIGDVGGKYLVTRNKKFFAAYPQHMYAIDTMERVK